MDTIQSLAVIVALSGVNHPGFAGDSVSWEGWGHVEKIWELP